MRSTNWASSDQVIACQMPYSFSRMAVAVDRCAACSSNSLGNVVCMKNFLWRNRSLQEFDLHL